MCATRLCGSLLILKSFVTEHGTEQEKKQFHDLIIKFHAKGEDFDNKIETMIAIKRFVDVLYFKKKQYKRPHPAPPMREE